MVIRVYEGMESQSNQAPVGMTLTSTPINSGSFIMMNAANIERTSYPTIDFQLCVQWEIRLPKTAHGIMVIPISIDHVANSPLM